MFALLWQWDLKTAQLLAAVRQQHQLQARRWAVLGVCCWCGTEVAHCAPKGG